MTKRESGALVVFLGLTAITVGWWALAFWPTSAPSGELLQRTREVCFGVTATGLPDGAGWMALVLQPTIMFGMFFMILGAPLERAVQTVLGRPGGRVALGVYVVGLFAGLSAVGVRVTNASDFAAAAGTAVTDEPAGSRLRLDRPAPALSLVDQHGEMFDLEAYRGRPVLLTFAFGHCETVCPAVVHDALAAQAGVGHLDPAVVVVSLDPWRDLPTRLPHIAEQWQLGDDGRVLSGPVSDVEAVLDAWQVPRARDVQTGDIIHPRLVYLIDRNGVIAFASNGGPAELAELLQRS